MKIVKRVLAAACIGAAALGLSSCITIRFLPSSSQKKGTITESGQAKDAKKKGVIEDSRKESGDYKN